MRTQSAARGDGGTALAAPGPGRGQRPRAREADVQDAAPAVTADFGGRPHSALALFLGRSIPLTRYAVVVPIEFGSIARLTTQERCNASIAGSVAILVIGE